VQLIVDHSLAVECGGYDPDAFEKNRAIEDRRNEDRFHFIDWTKQAFKNVDVIPPGNGIMHQINLEKMSPVIYTQDGVAFPDTCVGTDSHTPHVDALGVIAIGVGGLEAENVMLGRASWMRTAGHRRRGTDRQAAAGHHRHRRGAGADRIPAQGRRWSAPTWSSVAKARRADHRRPRHDLQHGAGVRRHRGDVLHRRQHARLPAPDRPRATSRWRWSRPTRRPAGLWADDLKTAQYERTLHFDLSTVVRNMAGPSNPHIAPADQRPGRARHRRQAGGRGQGRGRRRA
jgi:hypothetical protein